MGALDLIACPSCSKSNPEPLELNVYDIRLAIFDGMVRYNCYVGYEP